MEKSIEVSIDLDKGIDKRNELNPKKRQHSRQDIYDNEGMTKATIQNWKKGKVPNALISLFSFLERSGLKLNDVIEVKVDGKEKSF